MKEILITTPAEIVGISKKQNNLAIVRLGHLIRFPKDILKRVNKLVPLIKDEPYYIIFEIRFKGRISHVTGWIKEIEVYPFYRKNSIDGASLLLSVSKEDSYILNWVYANSLYKASNIPRFGMTWKTMEVWNFNALILRQTKETPEDLKYVGIGLLSMFRKVIEPEMVDLWI